MVTSSQIDQPLAPDDAIRLDTVVTQAHRRLSDLEIAASVRPSALAVATNEYLSAVSRLDAALTTVVQPTRRARTAGPPLIQELGAHV